MTNITLEDAKAWVEPTKVGDDFTSLDDALEEQTADLMFARLRQRFDVSDWTTPTLTPALIRTLLSMSYVANIYDRAYSTDEDLSAYATMLRQQVELNVEALIAGTVDLPEDPDNGVGVGGPSFYPNDQSSALPSSMDDPSLGPAKFSMGQVW